MQAPFRSLLVAASVALLPLVAPAQTRKPAPKPTPKPVAKPVAKPAPAAPAAPARTVAPAPAPTRPAPPAPAPARAAASSGSEPFAVGTNAVNLGIGLGNRYTYGVGFLGGSSSVSPAISLSYERGVVPLGPGVLGVGGIVGYQGASYDLGGGDKWKYTDIIVMVRGAFHYPVSKEFDAYGGLSLGVRHAGVSFSGSSLYDSTVSANEFATGIFVGGRYYFTDSIGAFAELGYDQTFLKVGLAARF